MTPAQSRNRCRSGIVWLTWQHYENEPTRPYVRVPVAYSFVYSPISLRHHPPPPSPNTSSISSFLPLSGILILPEGSNAIMSHLRLRVSMDGGGHLFSGGSHARLLL
ncbi:hypothetical protein EVAR_31141_1 [Eumeta japonica]|uniref:Uncharacterized protein n=1 Tax=Eumeta variegata TaxID=151549 RepID=A0A4C1VF65_EUMVA|nr:hypothetical protein EVAR_31141_1 [Eumeta japonica]